MLKIIITYIGIGLIFSYNITNGQEIEIPEGVNYKLASNNLNKKAIELIKQEISDPSYSLFNGLLYCGPRLWDRFILIPQMSEIKKGNIEFRIPEGEILIKKLGKLIQNEKDFRIIWDQIRNDFKGTNYIVRKLNPIELKYFWSIIFYDIEEPIFTVENDNYKIILDLSQHELKLLFIEAI